MLISIIVGKELMNTLIKMASNLAQTNPVSIAFWTAQEKVLFSGI